jgi:hypothetical protein
LLVTGANRDGNAVYDLGIVPGTLLPIAYTGGYVAPTMLFAM